MYPNGHFVRSLGAIGELETEIAAVLVEKNLSVGPFSEGLVSQFFELKKAQVGSDFNVKGRWRQKFSSYPPKVEPTSVDIACKRNCTSNWIEHVLYVMKIYSTFLKSNTIISKQKYLAKI